MSVPPNRRNRRRRTLKFTKMHGLGNDFVVIDLVSQHFIVDAKLVRRLADRRLGIGCDQVLIVEPPRDPDVDFRYRIFNCDGQEVEQCGNGARCFARFVRFKKLTDKDLMRVETNTGIIELALLERGQVRVDMGPPILDPAKIPFVAERPSDVYSLQAGGQELEFGAVSMGNPHAVLLTDDVESAQVAEVGSALQQHPDFPRQVNVGFMQVVDRSHVKLRVFERGAGETQACGSGACAAVVSGILRGQLDHTVTVELTGGTLNIQWDGADKHVLMTGPATIVFEGQIRL
jgi:diaminopimelate epimerase